MEKSTALSPLGFAFCRTCQVRLSGPAPAEQHYASAKHQKKQQVAQLAARLEQRSDLQNNGEVKFYCRTCNIACDTKIMLNEHEMSLKHSEAVTKLQDQLLRSTNPERMASHTDVDLLAALFSGSTQPVPSVDKSNSDRTVRNIVQAADKYATINESSRTSQNVLLKENFTVSGSLPGIETSSINSISSSNETVLEEYEFKAFEQGQCNLCNVALTSMRMAREHLAGQKHINARQKWLLTKEIQRRVGQSENSTKTTDTTIYLSNVSKEVATELSGAVKESTGMLGCSSRAMLSSPDTTANMLTDHSFTKEREQLSNDSRMQFTTALGLSLDSPPIRPTLTVTDGLNISDPINQSASMPAEINKSQGRSKQCVTDRTVWFTCPICIKRLNSEKQLAIHVRQHGVVLSTVDTEQNEDKKVDLVNNMTSTGNITDAVHGPFIMDITPAISKQLFFMTKESGKIDEPLSNMTAHTGMPRSSVDISTAVIQESCDNLQDVTSLCDASENKNNDCSVKYTKPAMHSGNCSDSAVSNDNKAAQKQCGQIKCNTPTRSKLYDRTEYRDF